MRKRKREKEVVKGEEVESEEAEGEKRYVVVVGTKSIRKIAGAFFLLFLS